MGGALWENGHGTMETGRPLFNRLNSAAGLQTYGLQLAMSESNVYA